jgi:hypothetical protein
VGCWAHARRRFVEALKAQGGKPGKHTPKQSKARQGLAFFEKLYAIERRAAETSPEERHRIRQEQSRSR